MQGSRRIFISHRAAKSNPLLRRRLRALMKEHRILGNELAKKAGVGSTAVYDILSGKSKSPTYDVLLSICKVLKIDLAYLVGTSDDPLLQVDTSRTTKIPVIGLAETGAWSAMPKPGSQLMPIRHVEGPVHPRYPNAPCFGLEIADDSMNMATPYLLMRGMTVLCVDMASLGLPVHSGQVYAVRIARDNRDQAQTILRRVIQRPDGYELLSESNAVDNYSVLKFSGRLTSDPAEAVAAFGLPYQALFSLFT